MLRALEIRMMYWLETRFDACHAAEYSHDTTAVAPRQSPSYSEKMNCILEGLLGKYAMTRCDDFHAKSFRRTTLIMVDNAPD